MADEFNAIEVASLHVETRENCLRKINLVFRSSVDTVKANHLSHSLFPQIFLFSDDERV